MTTASQQQEDFTLNLNLFPYGISIVQNNTIVKANQSFIELVKIPQEQLFGMGISSLVFPKDRAKLDQEDSDTLKKHEIRITDIEGNLIWCEIKIVNALYHGVQSSFYYVSKLTRQRINDSILNILMKRMAQTGENHSFESMVTALTEVLGFHYAFIGIYDDQTNEITIRAMSIANELQEPFTYSTTATPCGDVIRNGSLEIGWDTQCAYPEDHYLVEWEVEAYIGVALKNGANETIGHLAVMDTKPIDNTPFITSLLSIFSYRLGVKMEQELQQKVLEQSEERYKSLFNHSFEAKLIFDRNASKIIEANDAAAKMFQYPKEAFNGMSFNNIKPEKLLNGMPAEEQVAYNLKSLDSGKKVHTETLSKRADGTVFPTDITLSIFGGDRNLIIVSYRDITEKKEAQKALEVSEKRFRSLFEYSFDAIFLMNMETQTYDNCNVRAVQLFKYSKEQLLNMSPMDLVAPYQKDGIDAHKQVMQNIESLRNNQRLKFEFNFIKSDGVIFEAEVSLLPIINEQNTFCITTIKDISEKKKQEADLNKRKLFLRKVIDLNPNLIFSKDKHGRFTVANKATADFLGVNPDDLIGKHWKQFYGVKEEIEQISKSDAKILKDGKAVDSSLENLTCCKGIKRSLQTAKMPILNENGEVEQVLNIATDISPHMRMEKELRDNNLELKRVNTELDHFVYRASHDLRAPLASILGFTNLTKSVDSLDEIKRYNLFIENQIKKLDGFIKDIISYSRIARTDVQKDSIDFKEIVNDVFESLFFLEKSVDIHKEIIVNNTHAFHSDRQSVTFILKNLLSNAIKYSRSKKDSPYIQVTITTDKSHSEITVKDNGIGIEDEYLPFIFDMFYRATEKSDGSGLGLFIVKQSVEKLSGTLEVTSRVNEGTTFRIILPNNTV